MAVTVPDRSPSSLGPALTNTRAPAANELSAIHIENIKDLLIEFAGGINTGLTLTAAIEPIDEGASPAGNTPAGSADLLFTSTLPDEPASYVSPYWLWLENLVDSGSSEYVLVVGRTGATRHLAARTRFEHLAGDDTRYHYAGPAVAAGAGTVSPEVFARAAVLPAPASTEVDLEAVEAALASGPLTVAAFTSPVLQTAATDLGGAGVALYPVGLSGPVDIFVQPTQPPSGAGKSLTLTGGQGAASENGGPVTIDAGAPNSPGVGGNVRIGRDNAVEVLIGRETTGSLITLEGTTTLLGHTPTANAHAATKAYVDAMAGGSSSAKASVRVATIAAGTLATSFENGDTIDSIVLVTGDRILIKDQVTKSQNGIYIVTASGAPTRALDFDTASEIEAGAFVFVEEGATNADSGWLLTTDGAITVGSTNLEFVQFTGTGQIVAGSGITKSGNTLSVDFGEVGDIAAIGAAASAGSTGEVADAGHVHAHGAQTDGAHHAIATKAVNGFLAAADFDRVFGYSQNIECLFEDEFQDSITGRWTGTVSGAGASVAVVVGGSTFASLLRLYTGTTATGTSEVASILNSFYTNRYTSVTWEVKAILSALSTNVEEYDAFLCYVGSNGVCFLYDRNTSVNWQTTKLTAGVPGSLADTGIPADTALHSFRWVWTSAAGGTVTLYIDGVAVGTTYTGVTYTAATLSPARMVKSAGTTPPFTYIDYTRAIGVLATPRP